MSPIAHAGMGLLGWQVFDRRKTFGTLGLYILAACLADIDYLLYVAVGPKPLFIHQYFTHNFLFVLAGCGLLALFLRSGRSRFGLVLAGLSHLLLDIIVIDTGRPIGMRLLYPFSTAFFNLGFFPYLRRGSWKVVLGPSNLLVLGLEFLCFVLPVVWIYRRPLAQRFASAAFWRI